MIEEDLCVTITDNLGLPVRIFRNIPVMTLQDIANITGGNVKVLQQTFIARKKYGGFVDGYHYFMLKPAHISRHEPYPCIDPINGTITLLYDAPNKCSCNLYCSNRGTVHLTKAGFSCIVATMRNKTAIEIRRCLENYYFDIDYIKKNVHVYKEEH